MPKSKAKQKKRKFAAKKESASSKGFFARFKDIIPEKKETVRVKTFIVEKPVYVQAPSARVLAPREKYNLDEEQNQRFDSRQSRYSRREKKVVEDEVEPVEENFDETNQDGEVDDYSAQEGEEFAEGEATDEEAIQADSSATHTRSRGMIKNVWWRKALFWAILIWLLILAASMAMQAIKLIEVDLTRQWWILLAGLIVISLVYFKFFEGKL